MVFLRNWNSFRAWRSFQKLRYRNSATFKMEVFATIGNGRKLESYFIRWVFKQWTVCACCWGNLAIFTSKIKIGWKWPRLEGGPRYTLLFCRHVLTFFFQKANYSLFHLNSVSIRKLITKMKTGIIVDFIFLGSTNRSNHQHVFWKMLLIKWRENSCEGVIFKKLKTKTSLL